jgi:hypothetical protein
MMNMDFKKFSIAQPHARLTLKVLHRPELLESHLLASTLPCSLEALLEALLLEALLVLRIQQVLQV